MYTFEDAIRALEQRGCQPKKSGNGYQAKCPCHDDQTASLSIAPGDKQPVVMTCHAGCTYANILKALGLDTTRPSPANQPRIVATYRYRDLSGSEVRQKIRYEPKDFRIRHQDASGNWVYKAGPGPAVLYRLPELRQAIAQGATVFVVEGEKDCDRLHSMGFVATCNIEGAAQPNQKSKWRREYTEQLAGCARLVLIPDNDAPGRAHMAHVARQLRGKVGDLRWLELPGLPAKGDVSDWLNQGNTKEEFLALMESAGAPPGGESQDSKPDAPADIDPELLAQCGIGAAPPPEAPPEPDPEALELKSAAHLTPVPVNWLWHGWLATGKVHVMAGPPGTGKTTVAMALAATLTGGGRWPSGELAEPMNVVIWSGEDDPTDTLVPRLLASGADLHRVYFVDRVWSGDRKRAFDPATDIDLLRVQMERVGNVGLVIVDPLVSAVAGDSHKNGEVRRSLQPLVDLAQQTRAACLGITHFAKSSHGRDPVERVVGSIAFGALARVVMAASKMSEEQGGGRMLVRAKSNLGPDTGGFKYELRQGELAGYPGIEASWAMWGEALQGEARTLLDSAEASLDPEEKSALEDAKEFLLTLLADGPVLASQIRKEADENGYCWRTVNTAKKALCIIAAKSGMKDKWRWEIPPKDANTPPKNANDSEECRENRTGFDYILRGALHSSQAPTDAEHLVRHLLNGSRGLETAALQILLSWNGERWQRAKNDALQRGWIYCEQGRWYAQEARPSGDF